MPSRSSVKLNPNDEVSTVRREREERRKARLLQVREQEKAIAKQLRASVQKKQDQELKKHARYIQEQLERNHEKDLRQLEEKLFSQCGRIGQGHIDAQSINEEEKRLQEIRLILSAQQRAIARDREAVAMRQLAENNERQLARKSELTRWRRRALAAERQRAKEVVASPLHPTTLIMEIGPTHGCHTNSRVQGVESFTSTYFHLPGNLVEKESVGAESEPNAVQVAQQITLKSENHQKQWASLRQEQDEKAWLRHKHALSQVRLEKERRDVIKDLSLLAKEDRTHRRKALTNMPDNLFQPVAQQVRQKEEKQRHLEHIFEKMYIKSQDQPPPLKVETRPPHSHRTTSPEQPYPLPHPPSSPLGSVHRDPALESEADQSVLEQGQPQPAPPIVTPELSIHTMTTDSGGQGHPSTALPTTGTGADSNGHSVTGQGNKSRGIQGLVAMIRSQQEAWHQRLAERETFLQQAGNTFSPHSLSTSNVGHSQLYMQHSSHDPSTSHDSSTSHDLPESHHSESTSESLDTVVTPPIPLPSTLSITQRQMSAAPPVISYLPPPMTSVDPLPPTTTTSLSYPTGLLYMPLSHTPGYTYLPYGQAWENSVYSPTPPHTYPMPGLAVPGVCVTATRMRDESSVYSPTLCYAYPGPATYPGPVGPGACVTTMDSGQCVPQQPAALPVSLEGEEPGEALSISSLSTPSTGFHGSGAGVAVHGSPPVDSAVADSTHESSCMSNDLSRGSEEQSHLLMSQTVPRTGQHSVGKGYTEMGSSHSKVSEHLLSMRTNMTSSDPQGEAESVAPPIDVVPEPTSSVYSPMVAASRLTSSTHSLPMASVPGPTSPIPPPVSPPLSHTQLPRAQFQQTKSHTGTMVGNKVSLSGRSQASQNDAHSTHSRPWTAADPHTPSSQSESDSDTPVDLDPLSAPLSPPPTTSPQTTSLPHPHADLSTSSSHLSCPLSLQEAFLRKKEAFIRQSQDRVKHLQTRARERQVCTAPPTTPPSHSAATHLPRGMGKKGKAVAFASPLVHEKRGGPPACLLSNVKEKISNKESRERTLRFYNKLPEVKERRQRKERAESYATNRQRAKIYIENLKKRRRKSN